MISQLKTSAPKALEKEKFCMPKAPKPSANAAPIAAAPLTGVETSPRRIGVELEFARLTVDDAARLVEQVFKATVVEREAHSVTLETPRDGAFKVILDTRHAHKGEEDSEAMEEVRRFIGDVASLVVPVEIVCPPLPESRLSDVQRLIDALRRSGAAGANAGLLYAFGTHLNVETPEPTVERILNILRAYILLDEWLRVQVDVNPTRSAIGFEARFPLDYQRLVMTPDYKPDQDALIADYVRHNPTRNRGLDLLPVLAHLDEAAVAALLPNEKVSARPAYHYRLPNCEVDEPGWSIHRELSRWQRVERLASDRVELSRAMARFEIESGWLGSAERTKSSLALGERLDREALR